MILLDDCVLVLLVIVCGPQRSAHPMNAKSRGSDHDIDTMIAQTVEKYGQLDSTLNNAGIEGEGGHTHECSEANWVV